MKCSHTKVFLYYSGGFSPSNITTYGKYNMFFGVVNRFALPYLRLKYFY